MTLIERLRAYRGILLARGKAERAAAVERCIELARRATADGQSSLPSLGNTLTKAD